MPVEVLTIGHSNHSIARFLELLATHGVELAVDTRTYPRSKFAPQFNRDALRESLAGKGIGYLYLGRTGRASGGGRAL